ncbi:unnamed protein product [Brassicogethes aeneus]|uniref:Uncharacterized protein n=1 Tax=Brassicogethes aeneus TaxID=1431903 RepID=A0A9P0BIU8_BRAAE|nr:unnamed protein product [Brassicogethes aeneus]
MFVKLIEIYDSMSGHCKTASRLRSKSNSFRSYPFRKHRRTNPKSNPSLGKYRVKGHHDLDQYNEKPQPKTKTSIDNCKSKTRRTRKYAFTRAKKLNICHKSSNSAVEESVESTPKERSRSNTVARKMSIKTPSRLNIATKRSMGDSLSRSRSRTLSKIPRKRLPLRRSSRNMSRTNNHGLRPRSRSQMETKKSKASGTNLVAKIEKVSKTVLNNKISGNSMKTKSSMCQCDSPVSSNEKLFSVNRISAELRSSKRNLCRRCGNAISVENTAESLEEVGSKIVKSEVNNSVSTLNSTQKNSLSKLEKLGQSQSQVSMPSRNVSPSVSEHVLKLEKKQSRRKKKASDVNIADLKNVKVEIKQENVEKVPLKRKISRKRLHTNPFINFLRQFKKNHQNWHTCKVAIEGSRKWCAMADKERMRFALPGFSNTITFGPIIHKSKQKKLMKKAANKAAKPSRRKSVNRRAKSSGRQQQVK